ncbi:MAG: cytochrome c peroxidase [Planctomycetota bacterium]|nr:cytochrome c peroxidase [Planctomycetota bacterium]
MIRLIFVLNAALIGSSLGLFVNDPTPNPKKDDDDPKLPVVPKDTLPAQLDLKTIPDGLDARLQTPDNPLTQEVVALGRKIFFDPILSENNSISCASCHQPEFGFASNNKLAIGIGGKTGKRNSPTLLNRAYGKTFFWDGRAASLEEQALKPIENETELGSSIEAALERIKNNPDYVERFQAAFGGDNPVSPTNLAKALAAFQRALLMGNSPVDQFQSANYGALTDEERQGLWIYESRGGCWKCHSGSNYSDEEFHNTGVSFGSETRDRGLAEISGDIKDSFKFKTPTLRGVALTAPYFHDGSAQSLEAVVEFYSKGGAPGDTLLDPKMQKLNLTEADKKHLVAFLKALSR